MTQRERTWAKGAFVVLIFATAVIAGRTFARPIAFAPASGPRAAEASAPASSSEAPKPPPQAPSHVAAPKPAAGAPSRPPAAKAREERDERMPSRVMELMATEVDGLRNEAQVDAYLDQLVSRAERRGRAGALEIEPGLEALRRIEPAIGHTRLVQKSGRFLERLQKISGPAGAPEEPIGGDPQARLAPVIEGSPAGPAPKTSDGEEQE